MKAYGLVSRLSYRTYGHNGRSARTHKLAPDGKGAARALARSEIASELAAYRAEQTEPVAQEASAVYVRQEDTPALMPLPFDAHVSHKAKRVYATATVTIVTCSCGHETIF